MLTFIAAKLNWFTVVSISVKFYLMNKTSLNMDNLKAGLTDTPTIS